MKKLSELFAMRFNNSRSQTMTSTTIATSTTILSSKSFALVCFVVMSFLCYCFCLIFGLLSIYFCLKKYQTMRLTHPLPLSDTSQPPSSSSGQTPTSSSLQPPIHGSLQPPVHGSSQPPVHGSSQPPANGSRLPQAIGSSQQSNRYFFRPRKDHNIIRTFNNMADFDLSDRHVYIDSSNRSDITYGKSENYLPSSHDSIQTEDNYEPV